MSNSVSDEQHPVASSQLQPEAGNWQLTWERRLGADPNEQRLASERSEGARLAVGRRKGWSAVPGSNFDVTEDDDALVLRGRGLGHGVGLCQAGASGLAAERHATFAEILAWYYPGTVLEERQQRSRR